MQSPRNASAGFGTRLVAYLIDNIILAVASGIVLLPIAFSSMFDEGSIWNQQVLFHYTAYAVLVYCIRSIYFVILTYAFGKTLGKMVLRIQVESTDGEKLTFVNVLFRETVGRFLSSLMYVGYLLALSGKDHQALHDMLCDTRVCYTDLAEIYRRKTQWQAPPTQVTPQMRPPLPPIEANDRTDAATGGYTMPQSWTMPQNASEAQQESSKPETQNNENLTPEQSPEVQPKQGEDKDDEGFGF